LALADSGDYDVLVIDRMLPKRDGLSLIGNLAREGQSHPGLILSALGQVDDTHQGPACTAAMTTCQNPIHSPKLLARFEVLSAPPWRPGRGNRLSCRRPRARSFFRTGWRVAGRIDAATARVPLLEYLMKHAGQVVTRRPMLLENVWDIISIADQCHRRAYSRLRSKIERVLSGRCFIRFARGIHDP